MATHGSHLRSSGFGIQSERVAQIFRWSVDWLPANRKAVSALIERAQSSGVVARHFSSAPEPRYCTEDTAEPMVELRVRWSPVSARAVFCLGNRTPPELRQLVDSLQALYEYPDDMRPVPSFFSDSTVVIRFARQWEDGGKRATCRDKNPEDYVMFLRTDGTLTVVGRRASLPNANPDLDSATTAQLKDRVLMAIKLLEQDQSLPQALTLTPLEPSDIDAGYEKEPVRAFSLHIKRSDAANVLSTTYNPEHLAPQQIALRLENLRRLGEAAVSLLHKPQELDAYCQNISPRR